MHEDNQKPISIETIDTDSMDSWGDREPEHSLEDSVEIVGLELLLEHPHFDSCSDDATSSSISTPVDSLYLARVRNPGIVHISRDVRREAPGSAKKKTKPRRARRPGNGIFEDCEDWEIDSLVLDRERLPSIYNDRKNRKQNTTEKKTREESKLPFKLHDMTPNAFPDVVAMSEPNIRGFNCAA